MQGAITIAIGITSYFFIADSPETAWYLSPRQKLLTRVRTVQSKQYNGSDAFSWAEVRKAFSEPLIWVSGAMQVRLFAHEDGKTVFSQLHEEEH